MRLGFGVFLLPAAALAATGDLATAARLAQAVDEARGQARLELLAQAAALPWPVVPPSLEAELGTSFDALPAPARRAWALDRTLPLLAGEMAAPEELVAKVLAEVRAATPVGSDPRLVRLEEARRAYARGDLATALSRYALIPRDSAWWPEALRERAWALFVDGQPARALGAAVSLAAPYFAPDDQAEARLLEASVLIAKCRFSEARDRVGPLAGQLLAPVDPAAARASLETARAPQDPVGARAWASPLVGRVRRALEEPVPQEPAARCLRSSLVETGARLLEEAWTAELEARRDLAQRALSLRYDALRGERWLLEARTPLAAPRRAAPTPLEDDEVAWTFDGTFWRDELGDYRYVAGDACPSQARP